MRQGLGYLICVEENKIRAVGCAGWMISARVTPIA
jgi:hypothetical protein